MLNLRHELRRRKVDIVDVAELLGIHPRTVRYKLRGQRPFTVNEALAIYHRWFMSDHTSFEWLFEEVRM